MSTALAQSAAEAAGLTATLGVHIGHHTFSSQPTGCTAVFVKNGAVATVDIRGASPGSRDTVRLDPVNSVQEVYALALTGGSAFGLATADGTVSYLAGRGAGYPTRAAKVPIIPTAILGDLGVSEDQSIRPNAESDYLAAATDGPITKGSIGAGAGTTICKLCEPTRAVRSAYTPCDGDTRFATATGNLTSHMCLLRVGALAADATAKAILRGVRATIGHPSYPSARDLQGGVR